MQIGGKIKNTKRERKKNKNKIKSIRSTEDKKYHTNLGVFVHQTAIQKNNTMAEGRLYPVGFSGGESANEDGGGEFDPELNLLAAAGGVVAASLLWSAVGAIMGRCKRAVLGRWARQALGGSGTDSVFVLFCL